MPTTLQNTLSERVAPLFFDRYVVPLVFKYETLHPGITVRALKDWSNAGYRRAYVIMVFLISISCMFSLIIFRLAARILGSGDFGATMWMTLYGLAMPMMFLNGGYFYDFTEQLGVLALFVCLLKSKWRIALMILVFMQLNKETALLMPLILLPFCWCITRERFLLIFGSGAAVMTCIVIMFWIRALTAHLPGDPIEWHLSENLTFWSSGSAWSAVTDVYGAGLPIPRVSLLVVLLLALIVAWRRGPVPTTLSAIAALSVLFVLLLAFGYRDELRNLSLALPLLMIAASARQLTPLIDPSSAALQ